MRNDPQPTIATDEHLIFGRIKKVEVAVARVVKCDVWKQPSRQLAGRTTIKFWDVGQHQLWIVIVICDEPRLCTHVQYPIIFVMRSQRWPQVKLCSTHLAHHLRSRLQRTVPSLSQSCAASDAGRRIGNNGLLSSENDPTTCVGA